MHKSRKREDNIPHNRRAEHARPLPLPPAGDVEYPEHRKRRREISRRAATSARFASPHIDGQGGLGDVDCAAYRNTATRYAAFH